MSNINKPSREAIKDQLKEEETQIEQARETINYLRKRLNKAEAHLKAFYAPEGGKKANERIEALTSALYGISCPTAQQVDRVYKCHGHFLLRFPNGQLLPEYDPEKARLYVQETARFRVLPEAWIIVDHQGQIVSFSAIKKPFTNARVKKRIY